MRPLTRIRILNVRLGIFVLAAYWLLIFAGTHLPSPPDVAAQLSDKSKHFIAYLGLTWLLCYVTQSSHAARRFTTIAVVASAYAVLDELTQGFVPGRQPDVWDLLADLAGILAGLSVYLFARIFSRRFLAT
ncbi:MAG: VanZ family protein [Planctomycetota bacterium]